MYTIFTTFASKDNAVTEKLENKSTILLFFAYIGVFCDSWNFGVITPQIRSLQVAMCLNLFIIIIDALW